MNSLARIAFVSFAVSATAYCAPFLAIGDGAELFMTGTLGVRADDNVFLQNNKTSDTIYDINPGVQVTFGKDAQLKGSLSLVDAISRYSSNSNLDTNLFSGIFSSKFDDGKLKLGFDTSYVESNQNTVDVRPTGTIGALIRRDTFAAATNAETEVSQITSAAAGFSFTHINYKRAGYGDSDDYTIPVDFYYKYSQKLDLSVGYRYRSYQTQIGLDSKDNFFNIGARGEFSPKLTGKVEAGWIQRQLSRGGNQDQFGLDASLTYEISPKTSLNLLASDAPDTSPQGLQQKNLSFGGNLTTNITEQWSVNGGLSYRGINYLQAGTTPGRTDDYVEGSLGATYVVNAYTRIVGSYAYRHNSSKISSSEFTNNVFTLAANLRY